MKGEEGVEGGCLGVEETYKIIRIGTVIEKEREGRDAWHIIYLLWGFDGDAFPSINVPGLNHG